jgi:hypothetical protein
MFHTKLKESLACQFVMVVAFSGYKAEGLQLYDTDAPTHA